MPSCQQAIPNTANFCAYCGATIVDRRLYAWMGAICLPESHQTQAVVLGIVAVVFTVWFASEGVGRGGESTPTPVLSASLPLPTPTLPSILEATGNDRDTSPAAVPVPTPTLTPAPPHTPEPTPPPHRHPDCNAPIQRQLIHQTLPRPPQPSQPKRPRQRRLLP